MKLVTRRKQLSSFKDIFSCSTGKPDECDNVCTLQSVVKSSAVVDTNAGICSGSGQHSSNEALLMKCCYLQNSANWTQGQPVMSWYTFALLDIIISIFGNRISIIITRISIIITRISIIITRISISINKIIFLSPGFLLFSTGYLLLSPGFILSCLSYLQYLFFELQSNFCLSETFKTH